MLAVVIVGAMPAVAAARTDNRSKPVVFVHGLDAVGDPGVSCTSTWDDMRSAFRTYGYTGALDAVGYYEYDSACDHSINSSGGSPGSWYPSGHYADGGHGANTNIEHLGYHLAWYVYDRYSSKGTTVDLVGHSMGGLIIRYAVAGVQRGLSGFPPKLLVEDAVTIASPHGGARAGVWLCPYTECDQMHAGSSLLKWMESNAWNPQAYGGTDWSSMGSDQDNYVAADRAVGENTSHSGTLYFGSCHKVWYRDGTNLEHSDFLHRTGDAADYSVYRVSPTQCGGSMVADSTYHRPVRQTDYALVYGDR
jgi:pimeloyl-ACP methyl ester carboxylesterase